MGVGFGMGLAKMEIKKEESRTEIVADGWLGLGKRQKED